jgi:hemoglobin/transferrin/lactoferrin receptor protein
MPARAHHSPSSATRSPAPLTRRRHPRVFFFSRALVVLLAVAPAALFAATTPATAPSDPVLFPTVIVAATGYGTAPFDMPFATSVLSAETLDTRLPRTLPVALEELPGLMVQKTSAAQGAPYIRGFTGFRTLLLIDGIRLNNSVFREGPNQYWGTVDPLSLARLELVKGPASVLYGSDAVGGTVNAVSLTPTFSSPPSSAPPADARLSHRYASADDSHVTRLATSARLHDRLAAQIGLSHKNYHDLRAGRGTGTQPRTGYSESGLDASLAYRISLHARLTALAQDFSQDDAWRTHSTVFGSTWLGTRPGNDLQRSLDQSRRLFAVQLHADLLAAPVDELHLSISTNANRKTSSASATTAAAKTPASPSPRSAPFSKPRARRPSAAGFTAASSTATASTPRASATAPMARSTPSTSKAPSPTTPLTISPGPISKTASRASAPST